MSKVTVANTPHKNTIALNQRSKRVTTQSTNLLNKGNNTMHYQPKHKNQVFSQKQELRSGVQQLGQQIPDPDLQILMEAADVDGDGALNYGVFVAVTVHLKRMANDEHLHKAFAFFDQNQSGVIEIEELRNALNDDVDAGGEEVIHAIMHDVDTDKNGSVTPYSVALFNQASRIAILPLLSVTTSFVAEEDTIGTASPKANQNDYLETGLSINGETKQLIPKRGTDQNAYNSKPVGASFEIVTTNHRKRYIPSASPAMVIGSILGLIQAIFLISAAKPQLNFMGSVLIPLC
ncbi:hypothetical protein L3X38_024599 [Prunus dulcis]|uniref:EF-hand domain-containing protein n=1 Tax=Prunus dulcis TaxID=3755 RepID=A0AAD4W0Y8_PRUDU|nr:hypothetical protein L3X38_024599 [Prunus dulcis]